MSPDVAVVLDAPEPRIDHGPGELDFIETTPLPHRFLARHF
jgi:hypothetical protein